MKLGVSRFFSGAVLAALVSCPACLFPSLAGLTGDAGTAGDATAADAGDGAADGQAADGALEASGDAGGPTATTTFLAVADAWVRNGSSVATNNGVAPILYTVAQDPNGAERRIFLKFEVTALAGKKVRSALLRLECVRSSDNGGTVHDVLATTWQELGVTWNSQPPLGAFDVPHGPVTNGERVDFDVTTAVPGEGVYSFALTNSSNIEVQYGSREGTVSVPSLIVTF